jgi:hypothetical protein
VPRACPARWALDIVAHGGRSLILPTGLARLSPSGMRR